jgi:hypothetical protein
MNPEQTIELLAHLSSIRVGVFFLAGVSLILAGILGAILGKTK